MASKENTAPTENLNTAMFAVQGALEGVSKDGENPHFGKSYATLASVTRTIKPEMQANNLLWMHYPENASDDNMAITMVTKIIHVLTGESIETSLRVPLPKPDAQKIGSAMTYAMRYSLMALLGLAPKDDDGNEATKNAPEPSKATSRDEYEQIVEAIRGAKSVDELREFWGGISWSDIPKDWIGEIEREKTERVAELGRSTQAVGPSAEDSISSQFPGDMPNPVDSGVA